MFKIILLKSLASLSSQARLCLQNMLGSSYLKLPNVLLMPSCAKSGIWLTERACFILMFETT